MSIREKITSVLKRMEKEKPGILDKYYLSNQVNNIPEIKEILEQNRRTITNFRIIRDNATVKTANCNKINIGKGRLKSIRFDLNIKFS